MKILLPTLLAAFSMIVAAQSTCTSSDAYPIDADVAFLTFWTVLAVDWLAIVAVFGKRSLGLTALGKRDLECSATEECLSFRTVPFCYDKTAYTFHAADGTTGNLKTGAYTLPDGRQGNMFTGPYPTLTKGEVTATETSTTPASSGATMIASTPVSVTATPASTVASQSEAKTGSRGATSTGPVVVATQGSETVLKSDALSEQRSGSAWRVAVLGFGMMMVELWF
ncbi:uncharacterized protein LY89DRAFT_680853 [Mollisia scopiformis]|uniref:Uncharacterized protein n=1 Tax=Mollisia scopiformis TaxID=149040 RepID=A0A194XRR4_MOLSC|nr:uncharacterized protein LY89DRAFT_680853 [Mollisia scopiformis]KUJ22739.1 hypothetical protein LY89DRAFT_680853 [Mollisia scopiformis]